MTSARLAGSCDVLVVSACDSSTETIRRACSSLSLNVSQAHSLDEMATAFKAHTPWLAIYDMEPVGASPLNSDEYLHQQRVPCPWLIVAPYEEKPRALQLLSCGGQVCLYKPLYVEEIRQTLLLLEQVLRGDASQKAPTTPGRPQRGRVEARAAASEARLVLNLEEYVAQMSTLECANAYETIMRHVERQLLQKVVEATAGNQTRASQILGMNRNTLRKKLQELRIPPKVPPGGRERRRAPSPPRRRNP